MTQPWVHHFPISIGFASCHLICMRTFPTDGRFQALRAIGLATAT